MFLAVPVDGIVELEIDSVTVVAVAAKETFDEGGKEDILGPFPDNEEAKDVAVIEVDRKLEETGTWFVWRPGQGCQGLTKTTDESTTDCAVQETETIVAV